MSDTDETAAVRVGGFPFAPPPSAMSVNSVDRYDDHLQKVIRFYDSFADEISMMPSFHLGYDVASRWLGRVAQAFTTRRLQRILDLCCGQGRSAQLRGRQTDTKTYGLDLNLRQLLTAQRRLVSANHEIVLCGADAHALPLRDAAFDLVIIEDALAHSPERAVVFAEVRRVLRDNGCLVLTDVIRRDGLSPGAWADMLDAWAVAPLEDLNSYRTLAESAGLTVLCCEYAGQKLLRAQRRWDRRHGEASYEHHIAALEMRQGELTEAWGKDRYRARLARARTFVHLKSAAIDYALLVAQKT